MNHNEIAEICRQQIGLYLGILESEIPMDPWDKLIFDFAKERVNKPFRPEEIRDQFSHLMKEELKSISRQEFQEAKQRHHDYYVRLYNRGEIEHIHDQLNYEYAIRREKNNEVKPLSRFEKINDKLIWLRNAIAERWY